MEELERTRCITAEFGRAGGVGEKLQKLLEKRAEEKDNWVSTEVSSISIGVTSYFDSFQSGGVGWLTLATDCQLLSTPVQALATPLCQQRTLISLPGTL